MSGSAPTRPAARATRVARPAAASVFPALPAWVGWLALGTVLLVRCLTVGWVADDLVFMDAARRETFGELLSGRHGILGYYRPVSRELYFWLFGRLLGLGPFALHLVNALVFALMVGVFAATVRRLCGARSAWFAAALLILFPPTGALLSWISCAQDLIATLLVVLAMWWWVSGASPWWVAIACALAPLAKESAIVAPGLVLALELMWRRAGTLPERVQRVAPAFLGAAVAIAIQLAVRSGWPAGTAVAIWSPAQFANAWRLPIDFLVTWWPPHALAGIGAALRDSFALTAFVTVTAIAAAWAAERVLRGEHSEPAEAAERLEPRRLLWLGIAFVFIGMLPVGAVSELRRGYFFVIAALGASLLGGFVLARLPRGTSVAAIGALALSHWGANGFYEPQAEALGLARHAHAGYSFFRDNGQLTMRLMHSLEPACAGLVALPRTFALNVPTDVTLTTVMGPGARVACRDTSIHVQPIELMTPEDAAGSFGLLRFDAASERFLFEPVQPATRARLAEGLLFAGRPEVAAAGFVAAAQEMPGEPEIQYPMALALAAAGRAAEARSAWNEAKRLGFTPPPEQLLARLLYGLPTARADSLRARLEPAMRAAWSDAADSTAHRRLGRALIEVGLTRQASFELAAAAGLTHANEDLAWLGLAYERQGDVDRARVVYAQALRDGLREPTYGVARAGLSRVGVTAPPDVPRSSGRFGRFDRPTGR